MAQVDFYTHAQDPLRTTWVLCAKALQRGLRVGVLTPDDETAGRLDRLLWTHSPTEFLPHVRAGHRLSAKTPIVTGYDIPSDDVRGMLVNLCSWPIPESAQFDRLAEVVSAEAADLEAARDRYRLYRDRGHELQVHILDRAG